MERFRIRQIGGTNGVWGILVCKLRMRDVSANSFVFDLSKREKNQKQETTKNIENGLTTKKTVFSNNDMRIKDKKK